MNDATEEQTPPILIGISWAAVMIPLAWGFINTLIKASLLFR